MKFLGSNESKITKDKNGKNVPHLEVTKVVLVNCNIVNNDYQQDSKALVFSPKNHIFLETSNSEFQATEVWFTDQNSQSLELEDIINPTLVIK